MRQDVVSLLEAEEEMTNAIVLTHNIDFVFIQSVVLPALRRCGHPSLTIFADADCAAESYQHQHMVLDSLGTRFRVVPVKMRPGFRFHPKAILLSGEKKAVLIVGSGNLTFGGWRENAETWCRFDSDLDGTAQFAAFREYLAEILKLTALRGYLEAEVTECFDGRSRPWAQEMDPPGGLLLRPGPDASLIEQIHDVLQDTPVLSVVIHSPYFDDGGVALNELASRFDVPVKVAAQLRRTGLTTEAAAALAGNVRIDTVTYRHHSDDGAAREAFIHAKWYAFEHADTHSVFLGSANCSRAALTTSGDMGNAELLTQVSLPKDEFEASFIGELEFLNVDPQLPRPSNDDESEEGITESIRVSAARLDQDCLQVAYSCSAEVELRNLIVDGNPVEYTVSDPGLIVAHGLSPKTHQVRLEGEAGAGFVKSDLHWVDHEQELSTTARSRSLGDAVRNKVHSRSWDIGAWADVANVFLRNLQYMPERTATTRIAGGGRHGEGGDNHYTAEDVFSDDYSLPNFLPESPIATAGFGDRVTSLRQLLTRWFGYKDETGVEPVPQEPESEGEGGEGSGTPAGPVIVRERVPVQPPRDIRERDRRRALEMLGKVAEQMSTEEYLRERPPETVSVDLQFASVLLRSGLCEKWITETEFFEATHKIWTPLFFTSGPDFSRGWLEHRYRTAEDPDDFVRKLASPKLTAALAAWAFAIPDGTNSPEHRRFQLTKILAVARLPWLWRCDDEDEVAQELRELIASSSYISGGQFWETMLYMWVKMIRQGHALRHFEDALSGKTPAQMKDSVDQRIVMRGEVLWQGRGGFCVATEEFDRSEGDAKTTILYLQQEADTGTIKVEYAIPMNALLDGRLLPLPEAPRNVLSSIFKEMSAQVV